jgi:hypothetical protein
MLQKHFSHPSLVIYFFATSPIKLKLGQQIRGGLLIMNPTWTNHHDRPIRSSRIIFITLVAAPLPAMANFEILLSQKGFFSESNWDVLIFLHPILLCRITHIRSTAGDAFITLEFSNAIWR